MDQDLLTRVLRTPATYDIVVSDLLRPEERAAAARLAGETDFYGILRPLPTTPHFSPRAIDAPTAFLLQTLRQPSTLPAFARRTLGEGAAEAVARWVSDGILEIEIDGAFLSGPRALEAVRATPDLPPSGGRIARLSLSALESAAALECMEIEPVAFHLYACGRLPLHRTERGRLADGDAVLRFLFSGSSGAQRLRFAALWRSSHQSGRWLHWRAAPGKAATPPPGAATYKLYLSPHLEALPAAWSTIVEELAAGGAYEIKVGANAAGLLRPDKLLAYFPSRAALAATAEMLAANLAGAPAHGVPFTSEIAGDGLLSWGLDPAKPGGSAGPAETRSRAAGWLEREGEGESWRHWLVRRLARLLIAAKAEGDRGAAAVRFALARIALAGVDPRTWEPGGELLRELGADA